MINLCVIDQNIIILDIYPAPFLPKYRLITDCMFMILMTEPWRKYLFLAWLEYNWRHFRSFISFTIPEIYTLYRNNVMP